MYQFDRRVHQRYLISLEVEYKLLDGNGVQRKGFCRTINISTCGVLLDLKDSLPGISSIELSIKWPFLLGGSIPLKLMMRGNIVRVDGNSIAVETAEHEFHRAGPYLLKKRRRPLRLVSLLNAASYSAENRCKKACSSDVMARLVQRPHPRACHPPD
jgi:hypothetical protein